MAYTIEEAKIEAQKILDSVKRNNDTVRIDSLVKWLKENCQDRSFTEPAWDRYDKPTTIRVWSIIRNPYGEKPRQTIDDIIDEIIKLDKS